MLHYSDLQDLTLFMSHNHSILKVKDSFPNIAHFLDMVRMHSYTSAPTGKVGYLLLEICFVVVGMDPYSNRLVEIIKLNCITESMRLFRSANLLLRNLFRRAEFRSTCINHYVSLVDAAGTSKSVWRPVIVDSSNPGHVTTILLSLITCIQSVVREATWKNEDPLDDLIGECTRASSDFVSECLQVKQLQN